ncbi:MAG: F0F1 ATP synthase subunit A [bacterium]|nr:F0F1 ATP synthase subunit A [bacterium]
MDGGLHIALAAERLGSVWGIPITNTLISAWAVMLTLLVIAILVGRNPKLIPGRVQNLFEMLFEFVLKYMQDTLGTRELAVRFFPLVATMFLFIFMSNLFDFLPFFGSVGIFENGEIVPLFRPVNTDLNVTLALAIIAYLVIEVTGIVILGFLKYASKFVNFKGGVLGFLIGLIEFVSNFARLISFSFRLFGNVFAGEVLIAVAVVFLPYVLPVPLMLFETFVGLVQAAIFALLTLVFIKIAISEPHGGEKHSSSNSEPAAAH